MEHENPSHYEHHESHEPPHKEKDVTEKLRTNPWIISTFVLGILAILLIVTSLPVVGITGKVISQDKAVELVVGFVESQIGGEAELIGVSSESGLYKVIVLFQGSEVPLYLTKDGKNLFPNVFPLSSLDSEEQEPTGPIFTEEDNALIQTFSSCLYDAGMRVYYAGWCGYCHNLIETFGGLDNMGDMMVECQTADRQPGADAELCTTEGIQGFPTIKINGEAYSGGRTLEALGEATGCTVPELEGTGVAASSSDVSCN